LTKLPLPSRFPALVRWHFFLYTSYVAILLLPVTPDNSGRRHPGIRRGPKAGARRAVAADAVQVLALDALRRVVRALRLAASDAERVAGLTAAQLFVLARVTSLPGQSLGELARHTMTDRTSVAAVVERLAERRLVRRLRSKKDQRRVEIYPTQRGARTVADAPHPPTMRVLDAMSKITPRELHALAVGLTQLAEAMGLASEPATMLFDEPLRESTRIPAPKRTRARKPPHG
jgi:DNA-binding MarR family transcriptional regulator